MIKSGLQCRKPDLSLTVELLLNYLSINSAARCATPTSQKGNTVPIASVPITARLSESHVIHDSLPTTTGSTSVAGGTAVLANLAVDGFSATAVAERAAAKPPVTRAFAGTRRTARDSGTGTVGKDAAGAASCSINIVAITRR